MPIRKDVYLNHDTGDIELSPTGDIKHVTDDDVLMQGTLFRLKTFAGDYEYEPNCGASLVDFVGEPNMRETADIIRSRVIYALTHDEFLDSADLEIDVIPTSTSAIAIIAQVAGIRGNFIVGTSLDLTTANLELVVS